MVSFCYIETLAVLHKTSYYLYDEVISFFNRRTEEVVNKHVSVLAEPGIISKSGFRSRNSYWRVPHHLGMVMDKQDYNLLRKLYFSDKVCHIVSDTVKRSGYAEFLYLLRNVFFRIKKDNNDLSISLRKFTLDASY